MECSISKNPRALRKANDVINQIYLNNSNLDLNNLLNVIKSNFVGNNLVQYFTLDDLKYLLSGEYSRSDIPKESFQESEIEAYFNDNEALVTEFSKVPVTINQSWGSESVENLFKGAVANYNYLIQNFRYEFFHTSILKIDQEDENNSRFVSGTINLNNEIQDYLSQKFDNIQQYLIKQGYNINKNNLFTKRGNITKTYNEILGTAIVLIQSGDYFKLNYNTNSNEVNFLNDVIILTKLDELIKSNFNSLINIDGNYDKFLTSDRSKYSFNDTSQALGIYAEDDEMRHSITNTQSELFSLISSVIPILDKNGKIIPNQFLNSNLIQQIAIKINKELYNKFCLSGNYRSLNSNFEEIIELFDGLFPSLRNDIFVKSFYTYFKNLQKIVKQAEENDSYFLDFFNLFGFEMNKVNVPILNFFKDGEEVSYFIKTKQKTDAFIENLIDQVKKLKEEGDNVLFKNIDNLNTFSDLSDKEIAPELNSLGIPVDDLKKVTESEQEAIALIKNLLIEINNTKIEDLDLLKTKYSVLQIADVFSQYSDSVVGLQTWNSENKAIPTVRLGSSIFQDAYFIHRFTKNNNKDLNIFSNFPGLFSSIGNESNYEYSTGIKVDAIKTNKRGVSYKSAQSFTPTESLISEIKYGFLQKLEKGLFEFQPVAYSDKATIFTKIVNLNTQISNGKTFKDLINSGSQSIEDFYFDYQSKYYKQIENDLLLLWNNILGKKYTSLDSLDKYLIKQDTKTLDLLILKYLQLKQSEGDENVEIVKERDYSIYKIGEDKRYGLNKTLLRAIKINTNKELFHEANENRFKLFSTYLNENQIPALLFNDEKDQSEKLKQYLLLKNMFTDAYLSITSGHPWIHTAKNGIKYKTEKAYKESIDVLAEESNRYTAHGKRNNNFTASREGYTLNTKTGIIEDPKCAIIQDIENKVFNLSGNFGKIKSHDGSLFAIRWTQNLMANSLPGRKQKGTQKNFTHHVGKNYSTQIKDAQFEINNNVVRLSKSLDNNTVDFKKFIKKLCLDLPSNLNIFENINLYSLLGKFPVMFKNGQYLKLRQVDKIDGDYNYNAVYDILDNSGKKIGSDNVTMQIKSVYDLWELFGAEYSGSFTNSEFNFDETSMDIISVLMNKVVDDYNTKPLQQNVIHIFGPESAFKSGQVNVNPASSFLNDEQLVYFKLNLGSSGLQNDKNHIVNEDSIKEMSQVISALAANGYTKDLADEAYTEIASIIKSEVDRLKKLVNGKGKKFDKSNDFYKTFSKKLITAFKSADKLSLGQAILEISKEVGIPFSDPNLYHKFISSILVGLNSDTIRRKYTGLAGILTPSDSIVKVLENQNGRPVLLTDIYKQSIKQENIDEFIKANPELDPTNENLFNYYLNKNFPPEQKVKADSLNIGDWVYLNGKPTYIDNPVLLKTIQNQYQDSEITRIYNKARDLRPAIHSWTIPTIDGNSARRNIWSSDIIVLSYFIKESAEISPDMQIYKDIVNNFKLKFGNNAYKEIEKRIQQYTLLLDKGFDFKNLAYVSDFLLTGQTNDEALIKIDNYEVKEAECIMPALYAKKFNIGNKTLREVMDNASEIFTKQAEAIYKEAIKNTDITVNVGSVQYGIRFEAKDSELENNLQNVTSTYKTNIIDGKEYYVDFENNPLFEKIPNLRIVVDPEKNINYLYVDSSLLLDNSLIEEFLKSFNSDFIRYTTEYNKYSGKQYIYNTISKLNKGFNKIYEKNSINNLKKLDSKITKASTSFIQKLVKEKIATFELTQHIISSRIPAQSMQSFMAMENVGFTGSELNNIYVSRWQIWIQGSDFDIDVAYNLMYSINKHGKLYDYSPYFDYTSYKTLQESLKLPKPNSKKQYTFEYASGSNFDEYYSILTTLKDSEEEQDKIKYLKTLKYILDSEVIFYNTDEQKTLFEEIIKNHNSYSVNTESSKNLILSRVREISNNIKNMQNSYTSVDLTTGKFKFQAAEVTKNENAKRKSLPSMYDGYSNFEMQKANYVGKKTVGIFANALKGFFALTQYFNTHPEEKITGTIMINGKEFLKRLSNRITEDTIKELEYAAQCDLDLSAFLSLATDNAKELILGVLNAGMEFAGSYAYLLVMGVPLEEAVKLFTSPTVKSITDEASGNIFTTGSTSLSKLIKQKGSSELKAIYESAQEFRALTSILSINQGVKNTPHELIAFKNQFQSIFNTRLTSLFKNVIYEKIENFHFQQLLDKLGENGVIVKIPTTKKLENGNEETETKIYFKNIEFNRFFNDENYRKLIIEIYDYIKDTFNVYKILEGSKSFYHMLEATSLTDESLQDLSIKYANVSDAQSRVQRLFKILPSVAFNGQFVNTLDEKQIKSLQNMIDNKIIYNWLNQENIKNQFTFNEKDFYQFTGSIKQVKNKIIDFSTNEGLMRFKELVENIIIGQVLKKSPVFYNNEFVKNLVMNVDKYGRGSWYKLKFNLSQSTDVRTQVQVNSVFEDFNKLKNLQIPIPNTSGKFLTFGSILYVYNLIATKNKLGQDKLSMIFEQEILDNELVQSFFKYESDLDLSNDENFLSDEEFLFALYGDYGFIKIPKTENQYGQYFSNETDQNLNDSEEPDSTSMLEENEEVPLNKNRTETDKDNENFIIYVSDNYKGNEFKNLITQKESILSYTQDQLIKKLLNYIQSNSVNVLLRCE